INAGPGAIDPAAPKILRLTLGELPKQSYTAIWRARSAADGHVSEGSVPFGVGVAATTTSLIPAPDTPDPATLPPAPLDAVARWLSLLVAAVAFGGLSFALLVWRPAFRRAQNVRTFERSNVTQWVGADDDMTRAIRQLMLIGSTLFLLTNALF